MIDGLLLKLSGLAATDTATLFQQILAWVEKHPAATGVIGMLLFAVLGLVGTALWWLTRYAFRRAGSLYGKRRDRLVVETVRSSRKPTFQEFIDVYHDLFEEHERVATAEISAWIDGKRRDCGIGYQIFLARKERKAIGFGIVMFNKMKGMAFIPYVGLLGDAKRWSVSKEATAEFFRKLSSMFPEWKYVVVELDDPDDVTNERAEYRKRMARLKLFKDHCAAAGLSFHLVPFQYIQPPYHTDATDHDIDAMRLCIITRAAHGSMLTAADAISVIDFLYNDIYINCIWRDAPEGARHIQDTRDMLEQYRTALVKDMTMRTHYVSGYDWSIV